MDTERKSRADQLLKKALLHLVGGVAAAARSSELFDTPFFAERAKGSTIVDANGKQYIDLHTSFGAALLGYGHPGITAAVRQALSMGTLCAFETEYNGIVARKLADMVPCIEKVRFNCTGTETTYHTVKLARDFTAKDAVVKFEGHFHGFNDYLQYNYWPPRGEGLPSLFLESRGAPSGSEKNVIVLPFNETTALEKTIEARKDDIAAVILEPVNFNSGGIRPRPEFIEALRKLTADNDILLIFDEILSGFRTGPGCMQEHLGVTPDLCTIGKALGGGLPLSAFGGRAEIMDHLSPVGQVRHSGTYLAHPTAILACNAFLDEISTAGFWDKLLRRSERLYAGIREIIEHRGIKCLLQATGARFSFLFGVESEPENYRTMVESRDAKLTGRFFQSAMKRGLFTWTGFHHGISASHTDADVDTILERIDATMDEIA